MRITRQLNAILGGALLFGLAACQTTNTEPPRDAVLYQKQPIAIGTERVHRRTEGGTVRTISSRIVGTTMFKGRTVIRSVNSDDSERYFDQASRNWIASIDADGELQSYIDPHASYYNWPLFVGKSWRSSYAFHDVAGGNSWSKIAPALEVTTKETITVPAGTFETLRIESGPGPNVGFEATYWYAPAIGLNVKTRWARTNNHYQGAGGERVTVLVSWNVPEGSDVELID